MNELDLAALAVQAVVVLARMGAAAMLMPGLGEQDVPANIRLAIALMLVIVMLPVVATRLPPVPESPPAIVLLIGGEVLVGACIGLMARIVVLAMAQAGQMLSLMIGISSPLQIDPEIGAQGTALGRLLNLSTAVLMLSTGLYAVPLRALADSYAVLPPGSPLPADMSAEAIATAAAHSLELALRLAAPLVLGAVVFNIGLGLIARLAPQAQVFVVAAPGQILLGLVLLGLLMPAILAAFDAAARQEFLRLPGAG